MSRYGTNIFEIPCAPEDWRWINPESIMYGFDGNVYVKPTARTWGNKSHYDSTNKVDPCQIRRLDIQDWEVIIDDTMPLEAGVPPTGWLRVLLWEPKRTPLNTTDAFANMASAFQDFGNAASSAGRALASGFNIRLPLEGRHKVVQKKRRGRNVYHVPVVDQDTGQISTLVLGESKFKKFVEIGGESVRQIIFDDIHERKETEDDGLGLMDILAMMEDPP
jgi:hypothetical protein